MTTIAWDGITLAADTQLTGGNRKMKSRKLWRINRRGKPPILYGFAGRVTTGIEVRDWLIAGMDSKALPEVGEDFGALVVTEGQLFELNASLTPIEIMESVYGLGSGSDYAMGAMACGKTAVESIMIASRFDPATGADIESVTAAPAKKATRSTY